MVKKINKFVKLLCCLIISIFIVGFGGDIVLAAEKITVKDLGRIEYRYRTFYHMFSDSDNNIIYCLNKSKTGPSGKELFLDDRIENYIPITKIPGIINILRAGYPNQKLKYNDDSEMSDKEAYYVTQAAIWYYKDGINASGDGVTENFHEWLSKNDKYSNAYNSLIHKDNIEKSDGIANPTIDFVSDNGSISYKMSKINKEDGNSILLSNTAFEVSASNVEGDEYEVSVTGEGAYLTDENGTVNYGQRIKIGIGDVFKVAIAIPEDENTGSLSAEIKITPVTTQKVYSLEVYVLLNSKTYQNMVKLVSKDEQVTKSFNVSGVYDNIHKLYVQKTDEHGTRIAGAELGIYTDNNVLLETVTSTSGDVSNPQVFLTPGEYYLKEISAPYPYIISDEKIPFTVENNGSITLNGQTLTLISITNKLPKFKVVKRSNDGNPLSGVVLLIYTPEGMDNKSNYICGMTDENGLLTQESLLCDSYTQGYGIKNSLNSDGVYTVGKDIYDNEGKPKNDYYYIEELSVPYGYSKLDGEHEEFYYAARGTFGFENGKVVEYSSNYNVSYDTDDENIVIIDIKNDRYIDISKTDVTDTQELSGASLTVTRKTDSVLVDDWTSNGTPHRFLSIEKNVRYILSEDYAPSGYVKFSGNIEFELVDDNGTIKTYDPDTGEEIDTFEDLRLVIPNESIKLSISKTDIVSKKEVPGAKLKICTADSYEDFGDDCEPDKDEWSWISKSTPYEIDALPDGRYYLIETAAPAGYFKKTSAFEFNVEEVTDVQKVEFTNKPTKVTISKLNKVTGEKLEGAHFEILKASDRSPVVDENGNKLEWISKKDESWEIYALPAGEYILVETSTPEGYQEGMVINGEVVNEYKFTVSDQEEDIDIDVYIEVMNVPNTGLSSINIIAIGCLMIFIGYQVMKLYRRRLS